MRSVVVLASLLALLRPCSRAETPIADARSSPVAPVVVAPAPDPVRVETLRIDGDLDAYAVRGAKAHRLHMLFIPGMCVHPVGYVQAFQLDGGGAREDDDAGPRFPRGVLNGSSALEQIARLLRHTGVRRAMIPV